MQIENFKVPTEQDTAKMEMAAEICGELARHIEETEPYATATIRALLNARDTLYSYEGE